MELVKVEETPLGKFVRVQRKAREKRRKLMEKVRVYLPVSVRGVRLTSLSQAREGEGEVLDED